ncbi:NADH:flavin oxidoreductase [Candidatus Aerophobetes bacterium]|uniref:NADH:flavin oxidoreductase n=1 Tax=Aerophobetes bacterium TaxID=2030807 RepID=A0A662DM64_UNCAE|nr:MAG: NADH:flavin oxidoreductase [Candidatus Aerophobetes bacterium]
MDSLFLPISVGQVSLKNRVVMAPMVVNFAAEDGAVTQEFCDFYTARAKGGAGLIILGATYVHPDGKGFKNQLGIHHDALIPSLRKLCQCLHPFCKVVVQLSLRFRERKPEDFSEQEIQKYIHAFAQGARRAKEAGFDGVELHACHDYFINQFLSPYTNNRRNRYGGSPEKRVQVAVDTLRAVRKEVGKSYLVGCRISVDEFVPGGLTLRETKEIARRLEAEGADYIHASAGIGETQHRMSPPMEVARGSLLPLAHEIQKSVNIPVIGVGRLDRPLVLKRALEEGGKLAAVGRALIADPDFVRKIAENREDEIRPCIACNFCLWQLHQQKPVRCVVNPYVGKEGAKIVPAIQRKKVMVVGGGPAGLEAATVAARRGQRVFLFEKKQNLGGKILVGKVPPYKEPLQDFLKYLEYQVSHTEVELIIGKEVTLEIIKDYQPDEIIFATGSYPIKPEIPGINNPYVYLAEELLSSSSFVSGTYLVVGAGLVGLETAEFITARGGQVKIIEMTDKIGEEMPPIRRKLVLERLMEAGAEIIPNTKLISVEEHRITVKKNAKIQNLGTFDFVVLATGYRSNRSLISEIRNEPFRRFEVGDCKKVRTIYEAIQEGFEAGCASGITPEDSRRPFMENLQNGDKR